MRIILIVLGIVFYRYSHSSGQAADYTNILFPHIRTIINQPSGDTVHLYVMQQVPKLCGTDVDCSANTYRTIIDSIMLKNQFVSSIILSEELIKLARQKGDKCLEAWGFRKLAMSHDGVGRQDKETIELEESKRLYHECGDLRGELWVKMRLLERTYSFRGKDVIPEMEAILEESFKTKDRIHILNMRVMLIRYTGYLGMYDRLDYHVEELGKVILPNPSTREEYNYAIYAKTGRAERYMREKPIQFDQAKATYLQALTYAEARPHHHSVIEILMALFELEWARGNKAQAYSYLDQGQEKADKWGVMHLLSRIYGIKAAHAEREGNFKEALALSRKQLDADKKNAKNRAGHDLRNYYLQIDKDKLASEKENQALQIRLKNGQLISFILIAVIAAILATVLFFNLRRQKRDKIALATQNAIILQQTEQLKNLDIAKSRFFANVSHELRTPLTLLTSPIKTLLKENQLTDKQTQLLQMAKRSGQQLGQLINEILDLRKLEMGKMTVTPQATELHSYFQTYSAQFESLAIQKQIDYKLISDIPAQAMADIDREKCRQILFNLLSNAFKFTPQGGRIEVRVQATDNTLALSVAENGPGIHPDDLPRVFDRYFQSNRPEKVAEGGTGIGLALCKEYTQLFGGKIEVESQIGKGSIFRVVFPVTLSESTEAAAAIVESTHFSQMLPKPENGLSEKAADDALPTILVVEDNPDLQEYLRIVLSKQYQVRLASHGQDALDRCLAQGPLPNLILSDLMMPVMDGYQLLERVKSDDATRHIPLIMLTARAEAQDKLKALRIGVDDYLTKPFDEEELLVRIENLLRNQVIRQAEIAATISEEKPRPLISQPDREWLETFELYVQKHYSSDILSVAALAHEFAMSESTLLRQLKRLTGLSPLQYIQEVRLNEARRLLESRAGHSIGQVASKVGYTDASAFTRIFKQRFGKLPSELMEA